MANELEPWESLPDVTEPAAAEAWESLPDVEPASTALTNEELALRTRGPTVPLANGQSMLRSSITTDVAQGPVQFTSQGQPVLASSLDAPAVAKSREQEALEAKVRVAMEMGRKSNGTDLAQAAEIARQFNVPTSQVLPHLAQWKFAAESSTDDPADFIAKNRELVNQLADTPDVMAAVVLDPNVPSVIRALRVAKDMGVLQAMKNTGLLGEPPPLLTAAAKKIWDMANGVSSEQRAASDAQAAADEAAATERERNAKVTKFDNQEARVIRAAGGMVGTALTIAQRTKEAWYQQEMASGGLDLLIAEAREELGVGDEVATGEALARVQNARAAARPLLLGDEGTMLGVAGDNMQAIVSTSNVLLGKAKAAGVLGAVLGVAGGGVGGIVGKGPGAREGAMLGAETGAKLGSKVGGFTAAFAPETGGAYLENRDAVTDEGRRFTKLEAAGGALVYGAVASWLENLGADEVMAPAAGALKARVQKLLLNDPMFRSRAADLAKAWAKGMLSEGGTEGLQSISEQLVSYAAKSLKDEKLQRGPAWSDEQAATEAFAGMWGGGVTTAASTGVAVTWEMVEAEERARTSPQQVALIATLAEQAPVQAAPGEFAKVVTEASGVTEFWVDVTGTRKYQEDSKLDDAQLELQIQEAGGQEALDSYKESLATGGKFQVPLTTALKTWLKSPLGQALLEHTSTSDSAPTPRQVADGEAMAAIEAHAKELTEKAIAEMQDEQDFEDVLSKMEQDIADSSRGLAGISNPREYARDAVKTVRAQYSVVKSENPTWSWEQVVEHMGLLEYAKGDEAPVGQEGKKLVKAMDAYTDLRTVLDFGGKDGGPLSQEQAAELIFVDEVSNLRDPEAFDLEGVPEGMQVAMVTTPDAKAINDEPTGSHDATNALLRRMAVEVAKMDPRAARIGTNFAVRVRDQEQLDSLLEQLRGVLPAGVVAVGAVAQDREAAQKAMDALVDKGRADGVIPPRGGTAFDLATLPTVKFDAGVVLPAPAPVTDALLNAVGPDGQYEGREKLGTRAFLDRDVPGLLSGLGFRKAKKGKFTVALDLRGLRDVNINLGKSAGNAMLRAFGEAMVRLGGEAFAAAHLSGDEYAMTHDSQEALEEFVADLEAELQEGGGATYTAANGQTYSIPVRFRWGIAEGTYGRADQDLNTRKRAEAHQAGKPGGPGGTAREEPGAQGRDVLDLGARAGSVEQRNARALRRRGSERSRPFRDVAAELAAEQGEAGLGFGEDEFAPRLTSFASPEVVAEARRWVGRMRSPARKARFSAWLDYAAGVKERPTPELFLERDEGVQLVDLFGPELDNPEGSFFDTPLLQGVEGTKKTSRAEREQRRRARWNDAGMAENQASRMADANRARGKLDFDATGRRVLQEGNRAAPMKLSNGSELVDLGSSGSVSWVAVTNMGGVRPVALKDAQWVTAFISSRLAQVESTLESLVRDLERIEATPDEIQPLQEASTLVATGRLRHAWTVMNTWARTQEGRDLGGTLETWPRVDWAKGYLTEALDRVEFLTGKRMEPASVFSVVSLSDLRESTDQTVPAADVEAAKVWADEYEEQTGRMYQEDAAEPTVRPFVSQAQRRYVYATNRELAEKMRAVTPPGPLPERLSQKTSEPKPTKARRQAADAAADAVLRGEKVPVPKTGAKPTIREVALALQRRQRERAGVIKDFSPESSERIAEWMATEAAYEYGEQRKSTSGAGWYSEKFQQAMDLLAEAFPALKQKGPRTLMTAIIAITSDGQKVQQNLEMAIDVWRGYEATGKLAGKSWRKETANKLAALEELVAEVGIDQVGDLLLNELKVSDLKRELEADGKKFSSGFGATEVVPFAAGMFGPKLGVFFANLMGSSGYLTMDRWWNRTFNRYRGAIVPEPTRAGLERFKALLGDETMDDEQALIAAAFAKQSYEDKDYKNGTDLEKAGNTIAKAAFIDLNDRPGGATARKFMIDTAQRAVEKLKDRGIDLTVADLQAVLWYFEKRLYSTLGSKDSAEVNYEDAVAQLILNGELTRSEERAGSEGRAVSDARGDAAKGAARSSAASARFRRLEARRAPGERQPVAGVEDRFARVNGEEGSPAGHAGEVVLRERLYQEDTPSTSAVSPHKLSDGRSIVFNIGNFNDDGSTDVVFIDLSKMEATAKKLDGLWKTEETFDAKGFVGGAAEVFETALLQVMEGRLDEAVLNLEDALQSETEWAAVKREPSVDPDDQQRALDDLLDMEPSAWGSRVYPFLVALRDDRADLTSLKRSNDLKAADQQTLMVALDEFESQTGRLYQSDQAPVKLSDGRSVLFDTTGDETRVALLDVEKFNAALEQLNDAFQSAPVPQWPGSTYDRLMKKSREDDVRRIQQFVRDGRFTDAVEALRATQGDEADLRGADVTLLKPEEWGSTLEPFIQALEGALTITDAKSTSEEAAANDTPGPYELTEADQQTLNVAMDQFESATGRMRQDDEKKAAARPPKGYFIPPTPGVGRVMRVFLNRRADRSTVFHESAHGFLEMQHNAATVPGVSQKTKDRWARIMKWLGVSKYEEIKTEHHERWAKAFELYTKEGRAPKAELTSTFARMKRWLTRIYGAATSIDGVELDPEVRAIFDSMLATEQEIARQAGKRGQSPWTTAEEAGMTEEQFAEYQAEERESLDFSTREAAARFTKASLRAAEADFAEMLDAQRAKAEAEYEALPGRKAQRYLEGQALDLLAADVQMAPTVLDRKAVENAVGVYAAKRFRTRAQGATMPDDVAPMVQFPTGKEMLQAIVALPVKEKWVEARAKVLAEQADPQGAADLQKLRDDVANGLQKYTEEKMARLWAEFGRRAEPGDDVSELGRQVALQALKKAGRMVAERTRVGRLNPRAVLAKERQAARVVREAVRKGNFDAARDWFRQQTLQAYAHGAVLDAIEERQRFESLVARLAKPASRARFGKADPRLRDALDYLLAQFGLAEDTGLTGEALKAGIESIAETAEEPGEWQEALQTPELLGSGDYLNLTVAQLRHLDAALRQLDATVRFRTEVMVGEKMADRAATTEALLEEGSTRLPDKAPPVTRSTESAWETLASKASAADGFLLNPADLLRDLAGDNVEGVWWKTIIEPMRRAKYREAELLKQLVEPVTKAMEALPVEVRKRSREKINGRKMFPGHIDALVPRERHELLMMALNVGNEGNLQRLTDGRKITVEQVAAALDTLTDAELAWVESVWDAASLLKDESFALEERLTGLRPRGVEPVPFRLPSGRVLKGGYFPAVYDSRASTIGQKQAESQLAALQDPRTTRASTPHSHVKARAEAVSDAAIKLDPEVIYRHLAQVAHDVAFRETIKSVGSILLPGRRVADDGSIVADNRVAELLAKKLGPEKAGTFMQWLKDVGGASGANVTPLDPYITGARGAFAHVLLGWKLSTAVGDFANLPAAVASTSLKAKHLLAAQRDCLRAPFESRVKALEASPWLRSMVDTTRQQFDRSMKQMLDKGLPAPLQWYKDNAFVLMETVSAMTATPVWMGAHRQAIAEGRSHEEAVRFADDILSQVFPSHSPVDVAGILRDRGVVGLSTVMYGYLSVAYRAQHRILGPLFTQEFRDRTMGGKAMTVANVTGRLVGFYIAFSVMGELLMGRGPEEGDEDKDDPENKLLRWRNWFMRKLLVAPASTLPFADLAKAIEAKMTGKKKSSARAAPLNTLFEMISDQASMALDGDQPALKRAGAGLTLMLEGLGLPVSPLNVQGKFLVDVLMGDVEPEGPLDVASGLVYGDRGAKQPANIFKP